MSIVVATRFRNGKPPAKDLSKYTVDGNDTSGILEIEKLHQKKYNNMLFSLISYGLQ